MADESTKSLSPNNLSNNPFISGKAYEGVADKSGVIRIKVDQPVRGVMVLESEVLVLSSLHYNRNGYAEIRLTPQWEFLERRDISAAAQSFDFGTSLASSDHEIRIEGFWKSTAATTNLLYRINGASSAGLSNCHSAWINIRTATSATATGLVFSRKAAATAGEISVKSSMLIRSGENRLMRGLSATTRGTTAITTTGHVISGKWEDTTTAIRSVGLDSLTAGHILSGSHFSLYRRPQLNKTKIKLWIY